MRYRLLLSMLGLLAITSTPSAQPTAKLDGTWRAVAAERDGKSATDVIGHRLTFAGGTFTITRGRDGKTLYAGTYKTDPAKRPAQIDFDNTNAGPKGNWKGIYELDGGGLKTCDNAPDTTKARPTTFAAPAGSGHIFITFTREKS
jgi:uncharacterized protein (TIGR03067 family)